MEKKKSRNEHFTSSKQCLIPRSGTVAFVIPLLPARGWSCFCVVYPHGTCYLFSSYLGANSVIRLTVLVQSISILDSVQEPCRFRNPWESGAGGGGAGEGGPGRYSLQVGLWFTCVHHQVIQSSHVSPSMRRPRPRHPME